MQYLQYPVPDAVHSYVRYFWSFDAAGNSSGELHFKSFADKFPRLVFQDREKGILKNSKGDYLPACYISGIDTKPTDATINGGFSHFGVSFYPHALNAFFKIDATMLTNEMPALSEICSTELADELQLAESHAERVRITSKFLSHRLEKNNPDKLINELLHSSPGAVDLRNLHISERQLQRRFKSNVGISCKRFERILRFENSLKLLAKTNYTQLASLAYELGYSDQSHFIKEFQEFAGMNPYEFVRRNPLGSESASFIYEEK